MMGKWISQFVLGQACLWWTSGVKIKE